MLRVRLAVALLLFSVGAASAQNYPVRPIRLIVGTSGGSSDIAARLIAQGIAGPLGQPVVIENRSPAQIAIEVASKAAPDGYTIHFNGNTLWNTPLLQKVNYQVSDFAPVTSVMRDVELFVVNPAVPVQNIKDLIAYVKSKPGELNYASGATAGTVHVGFELFKQMAGGLNIVRVPYKGGAPAITALLGNEVQMTMNSVALVMPHVKSGKLKLLGVTSTTPSTLAPGVPTVASQGLPGYEVIGLNGMFAPAKTPRQYIIRLNEEIRRVLVMSEFKAKLFEAGNEVLGGTPEEFGAQVQADSARVAKVIKDANIKPD